MTRNLQRSLEEAEEIVFVCSGNMVRSAFAEIYARHRGIAVDVSSIATTYRNDGLFPQTRRALRELGISEEVLDGFRPTHMDDLPAAERARLEPGGSAVVFGMTPAHLAALPDTPRAHLLEELRGSSSAIPDPVMDGVPFDQTFARVAACVDVLLHHYGRRSGAAKAQEPSR